MPSLGHLSTCVDDGIKIELKDCAHMTRLDVFGAEGGRSLEGPMVL